MKTPWLDSSAVYYRDPNGYLFYRDGEYYRTISAHIAPLYRELLQNRQVYNRLVSCGLIDTEIVDDAPDELMVLRHRAVPFISYPNEWCGAMLRDAMLLTVNLNAELAALELELSDGHPWNVLFEGPRPVFIDFSSIQSLRNRQRLSRYEMVFYFFLPLYLMTQGYGALSRHLFLTEWAWPDTGHSSQVILQTLSMPDKIRWLLLRLYLKLQVRGRGRLELFRLLRGIVERMQFPTTPAPAVIREPAIALTEYLVDSRPQSVLLIGDVPDAYVYLAASHGCQVVVFTTDEGVADRLYRMKLDRVLPLVIDILHPTPAHGVDNEFTTAVTRLSCDMVIALSDTCARLSRAGVANPVACLAPFAKRWLMLEGETTFDVYDTGQHRLPHVAVSCDEVWKCEGHRHDQPSGRLA